MEGYLDKYTNVMTGYQARYVVIRPKNYTLEYYLSKTKTDRAPRGKMNLRRACLDVDDQCEKVFTISDVRGSIFRFQAGSMEERNKWAAIIADTIKNGMLSKSISLRDHVYVKNENGSTVDSCDSQNSARDSPQNFTADNAILKATHSVSSDSFHSIVSQDESTAENNETNANIDEQQNKLLTPNEIQHKIAYDTEENVFDRRSSSSAQNSSSEGSILSHLFSQLKIGMDLTKITLPTYILERRSLLEMYSEFFAHPHLLTDINTKTSPITRMLAAVRFYLSSFHNGRKGSTAKKPYNPVLGEVFKCYYKMPNRLDTPARTPQTELPWAQQGDVVYFAEQVSHHPPISAIYAECEAANICFNCHLYTKSKFLGLSIAVQHVGWGSIYLLDHKEGYHVGFPNGYGRSILTVPWFELGGNCKMVCPETGCYANITFHTKPFISGKKHAISAEVFEEGAKRPAYTVTGQWNGLMTVKSADEEKYLVEEDIKSVFLDTHKEPVNRKYVRSLAQQEEYESRIVWQNVTAALKENNIEAANREKNKVEDTQRALVKQRKEKDEAWRLRRFEQTGEHSFEYVDSLLDRKQARKEFRRFAGF